MERNKGKKAARCTSWEDFPLLMTARDVERTGATRKAAYRLMSEVGVRVGGRLLVDRDLLRDHMRGTA